jgi:hypothetical protein
MKQGEALHRYSLTEPPALSERSEDNPTWLCGDPSAARTIPCVSLGYLHGFYPTDRNSMMGDRMAFAKWYYIYLVILFINNLYKAGH